MEAANRRSRLSRTLFVTRRSRHPLHRAGLNAGSRTVIRDNVQLSGCSSSRRSPVVPALRPPQDPKPPGCPPGRPSPTGTSRCPRSPHRRNKPERTLVDRVVVTVANRSERVYQGLGADLVRDSPGDELDSVVGMNDPADGRLAILDCHVERVDDEFRVVGVVDPPAHGFSRERVHASSSLTCHSCLQT